MQFSDFSGQNNLSYSDGPGGVDKKESEDIASKLNTQESNYYDAPPYNGSQGKGGKDGVL